MTSPMPRISIPLALALAVASCAADSAGEPSCTGDQCDSAALWGPDSALPVLDGPAFRGVVRGALAETGDVISVPGVHVYLTHDGEGTSYPAITNDEGFYEFLVTPGAGQYVLEVWWGSRDSGFDPTAPITTDDLIVLEHVSIGGEEAAPLLHNSFAGTDAPPLTYLAIAAPRANDAGQHPQAADSIGLYAPGGDYVVWQEPSATGDYVFFLDTGIRPGPHELHYHRSPEDQERSAASGVWSIDLEQGENLATMRRPEPRSDDYQP